MTFYSQQTLGYKSNEEIKLQMKSDWNWFSNNFDNNIMVCAESCFVQEKKGAMSSFSEPHVFMLFKPLVQ